MDFPTNEEESGRLNIFLKCKIDLFFLGIIARYRLCASKAYKRVEVNRKGDPLKSDRTLKRCIPEAFDNIQSPSFITIQTEFGANTVASLTPDEFPRNNSGPD